MPKVQNTVATMEYAVSERTPLDYLLIARELSTSPSRMPIKYLAIGSNVHKLELEMRENLVPRDRRRRQSITFNVASNGSDLPDILARIIQRYVSPHQGSPTEHGDEDQDAFKSKSNSDADFVESIGGVDLAHGTEFQQKIWRYLISECPGTECRSYQDLSMKLYGDTVHTRAIGRACACNRIALLVPCHRVVRRMPASTNVKTKSKDDTDTYRWNRWRKEKLLDWELGGGLMTLAAHRMAA
ncbi:hypothetical protein V1525DRAFT_128023 [Lipomyces kononenkoae]|uniref:Uncharacterized protein n=1 Tax=Lipomyces kononenkoae TaxID=34357 RepID=A0ACC3T2C0_LIPKO